jgi:hypothetical protein
MSISLYRDQLIELYTERGWKIPQMVIDESVDAVFAFGFNPLGSSALRLIGHRRNGKFVAVLDEDICSG